MGVMDVSETDVESLSGCHVGEQGCLSVRTVGAVLIYAFIIGPTGDINVFSGQSFIAGGGDNGAVGDDFLIVVNVFSILVDVLPGPVFPEGLSVNTDF